MPPVENLDEESVSLLVWEERSSQPQTRKWHKRVSSCSLHILLLLPRFSCPSITGEENLDDGNKHNSSCLNKHFPFCYSSYSFQERIVDVGVMTNVWEENEHCYLVDRLVVSSWGSREDPRGIPSDVSYFCCNRASSWSAALTGKTENFNTLQPDEVKKSVQRMMFIELLRCDLIMMFGQSNNLGIGRASMTTSSVWTMKLFVKDSND